MRRSASGEPGAEKAVDKFETMSYISMDNEMNRLESALDDLIVVMKALSDRNRIRILKMLERRPLCVCEINAVLGLAVSTTSKHLSILRDAGLVVEEKEGKWVNYQLNRTARNPYIAGILPLLKSRLDRDATIQSDLEKTGRVSRETLCRG